MKIEFTDIDGNTFCPENIAQLVLTEAVGAACSSLLVTFKSNEQPDEIVSIRAYDESDSTVFNGYADCQKSTANSGGYEIFVYARSSACLLVDSQSEPFTFSCPTSKQLYVNYARSRGFAYALPEISSTEKYEVSSGTSCFGAINNFVSMLTGKDIYITPQNEIRLFEDSGDVKNLGKYDILSFSSIINRSEPISIISYKGEQSYNYDVHLDSSFAKQKNIKRERYVNLNALPQWQRAYTISQKLKHSFDDYMLLEVTVAGECRDRLYQRFGYRGKYGTYSDYILIEKKYSLDKSGEKTKLTLRKEIDTGGMTYVD